VRRSRTSASSEHVVVSARARTVSWRPRNTGGQTPTRSSTVSRGSAESAACRPAGCCGRMARVVDLEPGGTVLAGAVRASCGAAARPARPRGGLLRGVRPRVPGTGSSRGPATASQGHPSGRRRLRGRVRRRHERGCPTGRDPGRTCDVSLCAGTGLPERRRKRRARCPRPRPMSCSGAHRFTGSRATLRCTWPRYRARIRLTLECLGLLAPELAGARRDVNGYPVLFRGFEASVPAPAHSRWACGVQLWTGHAPCATAADRRGAPPKRPHRPAASR
jgi:hypothetical protein